MVTVVVGTRPEVMKMAPVVRALRKRGMTVRIVAAQQSVDLLTSQLRDRGLEADVNVYPPPPSTTEMKWRPTLGHLTAWLLHGLEDVMDGQEQLVLVQGDTTTALCGALSAFYRGIPVGHVEAGLRTERFDRPFPEEANRRMIARIASLHFTPTQAAAGQLSFHERVSGHVWYTGNTIVDELTLMLSNPPSMYAAARLKRFEGKKVVLVTCHRREDLDARLTSLINALSRLARLFPDVQVVWPIHPNPVILQKLHFRLNLPNVHLLPPLPYSEFLPLLNHADAVITDSGGVIEEAVTLNRRVVIIRDETERYEAVSTGRAELLPLGWMNQLDMIVRRMLAAPPLAPVSLYGDGKAGEYIAEKISSWLATRPL